MSERCDLAIVGAGIVGTMAAYRACRERPDWRILLLDRSFVGDGSTRYSLGLDIPYGRTPAQKRLAALSAELFAEMQADIPALRGRRLPLFGVVSEERAAAVLDGFTHTKARRATESEARGLRHAYPDISLAASQALLVGGEGVCASPARVASELVEWLRRDGRAECWEGVEVAEVRAGADQLTLATGDGRDIAARRVLVATGPWLLRGPASELAREAGVRVKKTVALHVAHRPPADAPVLFFFDEDAFLLPLEDEWLFSFTSQEWDVRPDISQLQISRDDRALALSILRRYCPSLVAHCHGGRVFCDAYSPDRVPITERVARAANYVVAGACSGAGYRLAPAIAREAVRQFA